MVREGQGEQQPREGEVPLRSFAETSPELFFQLNAAGEITALSPACSTMRDLAPEKYRGCHYLAWINPDNHSLAAKSFDILLSGARCLEIVLQMVSGEGMPIWAEIQASPRFDGKKVVGVQGMIREVSEQKMKGKVPWQSNNWLSRQVREQDQELRRNAAIGSLAASIVHEFNNPLCGVRSVVERMARKSELTGAEQGLLELALEQCDRMKRLIRNLQQFNLPFSDDKKDFELHPAIDSVLVLLNKHLKIRKVAVRKEYAAEGLMLIGVENQIKQALLNLIKNRGESMAEAGGEIRVLTRRDRDTVHIVVSDTGVGISPEHLPHLFKPFFTTKIDTKENGLGLTVAHDIVKGHQGEIRVESIPDQGTTFTVILPSGNTLNSKDI